MSILRFGPLLHVLAKVVTPNLTKQVEYLKLENEILRSKLPKRVRLTNGERSQLTKFGMAVGSAIKDLLSVVSYRTFQRWVKAAKGGSNPSGSGRPRLAQEIRANVLRLANETGWGATRIFAEMKPSILVGLLATVVDLQWGSHRESYSHNPNFRLGYGEPQMRVSAEVYRDLL